MLTELEIQQNWDKFIALLKLDSRHTNLIKMYDEFANELAIAPASGNENYHNCFPGGYIDHVLRVVNCAEHLFQAWKDLGAEVDTFTLEELRFAAINHDLGKAGEVGKPYYVPNPSEWHRKNQGALYDLNKDLTFMKVPDRSLYLLQKYNICVSENEYLAIKLHDGMYTEGNKSYYMAAKPELSLRSNIVLILHHADHLASRIEHANMEKRASILKGSTKTTKSQKSTTLSTETVDISDIANIFNNN